MKPGRVARSQSTSDQENKRNRSTNKLIISTKLPFTLIAQSNKSSKLIFGISPIKKIDFDFDPVTYKKTSFISFDYENYVNKEYKNTHIDIYNDQKMIKMKKKDKHISKLTPICSFDKVFQKHKLFSFVEEERLHNELIQNENSYGKNDDCVFIEEIKPELEIKGLKIVVKKLELTDLFGYELTKEARDFLIKNVPKETKNWLIQSKDESILSLI